MRLLRPVSFSVLGLALWGIGLHLVSANTPPNLPGQRFALVVGNSAYEAAAPLRNAAKDAADVADLLRGLNIEVISLIDATREEMEAAVAALSARAPSSDATLFYYSGHGFQMGGHNYLVPVDAQLRNRDRIDDETIRLDDVIAKLSGNTHQTLILLDACRNNPLPPGVAETAQGLAKVETGAGTFVAFATQPGAVAYDGAGENSPFTLALIDNLTEPGISISDLMIRVRVQVEELTAERQLPWDQSSLRSQFYFVPEPERSAALTPQDLQLLTNLSPELRAQFEQVFDIQITPVDAIQVASIAPDATEAVLAEMRGRVPLGALIPRDEYAKTIELAALIPDEPQPIPVPLPRPVKLTAVDAVDVAVDVALAPAETGTAAEILVGNEFAIAETVTAYADPAVEAATTLAIELPDDAADGLVLELAAVPDTSSVSLAETVTLPDQRDLATAVQTELSRLGCYRSSIDGDWGRLSKRALLRYYATRQVTPDGSEPSAAVLARLVAEPTVVCAQTQPRDVTVKTATVVEVVPAAATTPAPNRKKPRFETQPGRVVTPGGNSVPDQKSPIKITPGISMF